MGMVDYRVTVDLTSFKRFEKALRSNSGEINKAYNDWSKFYATFTRKRFRRMRRGGRGGWKKLKPATVAAKRAKGYTRPRWILYATGKMLKVLNPRFLKRTARTVKKRTGITVTYGGKQKYRGGPLVSKVMGWHQRGAGRLPRRRIFVNPDRATQKKMAKRMEVGMQKELDK